MSVADRGFLAGSSDQTPSSVNPPFPDPERVGARIRLSDRQALLLGGFPSAIGVRSALPLFSKGWLMRPRYRAMALPVLALGGFLFAGCGQANEESLGGQTS